MQMFDALKRDGIVCRADVCQPVKRFQVGLMIPRRLVVFAAVLQRLWITIHADHVTARAAPCQHVRSITNAASQIQDACAGWDKHIGPLVAGNVILSNAVNRRCNLSFAGPHFGLLAIVPVM